MTERLFAAWLSCVLCGVSGFAMSGGLEWTGMLVWGAGYLLMMWAVT